MLCLVSIPMHSFLAQTLTILLHFETGDPLHSIDCEQELFETAFDTNVHVEASVSYPRVPEATPLARYANEAIRKEAYELHDTFVQEMSTLEKEPWEEEGDERILRYDLSLVHSAPDLMSFYGSKYQLYRWRSRLCAVHNKNIQPARWYNPRTVLG